jgi:hypothetical protein
MLAKNGAFDRPHLGVSHPDWGMRMSGRKLGVAVARNYRSILSQI